MNREERRRAARSRQELAPGAWAIPATETLVLDPAKMLEAAGYEASPENLAVMEREVRRAGARLGIPITEVEAGLTEEDQ